MTSKKTINIYVDNVWAGAGWLDGDQIADCPADLGEAAYETIEAAIKSGKDSANVGGVNYRWEINEKN